MAGVSPTAEPIINIGELFEGAPLVFTNSMFVSWIVTISLILFAKAATKDVRLIPNGVQNFLEFCIESIYNLLSDILGEELTRKTLWFFASLFIFIVVSNWSGLLPFTSFYVKTSGDHFVPIWRPGTADVAMNLAMALAFMAMWMYWAIQANGVEGFFGHIFGPKGHYSGVVLIAMTVLFLAIGLIEVVSIVFRPISLSLRLYGNIFGGENVMHALHGPGIGVPIYFMEILVGFVQGLVFTMLSAVFTSMICEHHGEEEHH